METANTEKETQTKEDTQTDFGQKKNKCFSFKKSKSAKRLLEISELRTKDILSKIERLADGKIRRYQLHHKNDIYKVCRFCVENSIIAYVKSKVTATFSRIYSAVDMLVDLYDFYQMNWKELEQHGDVYLVVFKGYTRTKGDRFHLVGTDQAALS